jgi:hypothetical protein
MIFGGAPTSWRICVCSVRSLSGGCEAEAEFEAEAEAEAEDDDEKEDEDEESLFADANDGAAQAAGADVVARN